MSRLARRPRTDHKKMAQLLRARPGVWMVVGEYRSTASADGMVWEIKSGSNRRSNGYSNPYAPAGCFEARMVLTEFGTNVIARYIGGAS